MNTPGTTTMSDKEKALDLLIRGGQLEKEIRDRADEAEMERLRKTAEARSASGNLAKTQGELMIEAAKRADEATMETHRKRAEARSASGNLRKTQGELVIKAAKRADEREA